MASDRGHISANVERFSGFAELYDRYRPRAPAAMIDLLTQLAAAPQPRVVDIGSGSGLSTLIWSGRAVESIGVEPNADMRGQAERRAADAGTPDVRFIDGLSTATGLPGAFADIVTCSQALHWMEPEGTFGEVARIMPEGGVFAAYDCDWPPTLNAEAERAFEACMAAAHAIERERGLSAEVRHWDKDGHLERMKRSGRFRYVKEVLLHHIESGHAERLVGLALSQGGVATLLKHGISEQDIGLPALREAAHRALGDSSVPWFWSYRVRIGVK